ncbi:hypothetical protein ABGB14_37145 [Nonomuraea sp. B10E15]|uniref:hypothetical protein n=1 Tax=Nonomuraea sp. B10E15 TaxID=3153560 RepID=UPI00325D635D
MEGTHESLAAARSRNQHLGHQVLMVGDSKLISYDSHERLWNPPRPLLGRS